tara:strand:- start:6742 stop:7113 length:372 start_codon:yes stop_codon:yes gene_type:complete
MAVDFPNSPSTNDTHTENGYTWEYDGTTWIIQSTAAAGPPGPPGPATPGPPGPSGGSAVTTDDVPPTNPNDGDVWWDSQNGRLNVYYQDADSSQWVDATGRGTLNPSSIPNLLFQTKNWNEPL